MGWWGGKAAVAAEPAIAGSSPGLTSATSIYGETIGAAGEGAAGGMGFAAQAGMAGIGAVALYEGGKYVSEKTGMNQIVSTAVAPIVAPTMILVDFGKKLVKGVVGKDTVICSELYRQGLVTDRQRRYTGFYGVIAGDPIYTGYLIFAEPIVKRMKKSKMYTKLIAFFVIPAINEICHRLNPSIKGSLFGAVVLDAGIRHCRRVYAMKSSREVLHGIPC